MRSVILAAFLLAAIGCGGEPEYRNEVEEFNYLNSLSNPTLEQFRRRDELMQKFREDIVKPGGNTPAKPPR